MRELGKDRSGQLYGKSHPAIKEVLEHDRISFRGEKWLRGKGPDMSEMLSAMVLAYARLGPRQRRRLMKVLVNELEIWLEEGPEPSRADLVARCIDAIRTDEGDDDRGDGPSPPPPPSSTEGPRTVGGHTVGRKLPKRGVDSRHPGAGRRAKGDKVRPEPAG